MRWAAGLAFGAWLLASLCPAQAEDSLRKVLEGRWVGDGIDWRFDQDAMQVNRDPRKPFDWQPLRILNTTGAMIVFEIGNDRYMGLMKGDTLSLTAGGIAGTRILRKESEPPPARRPNPRSGVRD